MNIHFPQIGQKSRIFFYMLVALTAFIMLSVTLSLSRHTEFQFSIPSIMIHFEQVENINRPVAIPAPTPLFQQNPAIAVPEASGNAQSVSVPQAILVPMPSVP
jgi:hypothetical protein